MSFLQVVIPMTVKISRYVVLQLENAFQQTHWPCFVINVQMLSHVCKLLFFNFAICSIKLKCVA